MRRELGKTSLPFEEQITVTVRFITLMQRYSGEREIQMDLPQDPHRAIQAIIDAFRIPWKGNLEKSSRIFINKQPMDMFIRDKALLNAGDVIAFIPISGGG
jgi:molybdopterin converting factor small subunit